MPWKCPVCGNLNPDDVDRCLICGAPKPEGVEAVEVPQPPVEVKAPAEESAAPPAEAPAAPEPEEIIVEEEEEVIVEEPGSFVAEEEPMKPEAGVAEEQAVAEEVAEERAAEAGTAEEAAEELPPPLPEGARVYLKVVNSPAAELRGMNIPLQFDVFKKISIGRGPENVVIAPDPGVSRRHAVMYIENGRLVIEDLGSTNGTFVYDPDAGVFKKIQKAYLKPGDIVRLGEATILQVVVEA